MKRLLMTVLMFLLFVATITSVSGQKEAYPDTLKLKQGYSLHLADIYIPFPCEVSCSEPRTATLQLIKNREIMDEQVVQNSNSFSIYDGTTLIVTGEYIYIFAGLSSDLVLIGNLTQYKGNDIIYQVTKVSLFIPHPT